MLGFALILITAFFFPGIILRTKSIASGRKGPGLFQPVREIIVLLKSGWTVVIPGYLSVTKTLSSIICAMLNPFHQSWINNIF